jgi:septum formation protein
MSPTSKKLRKNGKSLIEQKIHLHETTERLTQGSDQRPDEYLGSITSKIVLGSSSRSRRQILEKHGWMFTVLQSGINLEIEIGKSTNSALHIATSVAHALFPHCEDSDETEILVTVAQLLSIDDVIYHPPQNEEEAITLLSAMSGKVVKSTTAVVATLCPDMIQTHSIDESVAQFQTISKDLAARVIRRNYDGCDSWAIPLHDAELKLRHQILNGDTETMQGMPVLTCWKAVNGVLNGGVVDESDEVPDPPVDDSQKAEGKS